MTELMKAPRFSLRQLSYFVAIAETGTISAAAERLHISQPAVSLALNDLERALKVQLCVRRKSHGITLTPTGNQVLRRARQLLRQAEDLEGEASAGEGPLTGVLSVGCFVTMAPTVLPPLLQGFSALHPGLTVDFTEDTQDVLQRRLLSGELDLAVIYDMDVLPEMARAELFSVRPHILLAADHPLADRPAVSLHDVAEEPMVLLDAPPSSHHSLGLCHRFGMVPRVSYRPGTYEVARALVGRGLGYSILVQRPANDRTYEGFRVAVKEIAEPVDAEAVLLAWPRAVRLNRRAEEFLRFCRGAARSDGVMSPTAEA
ncbi:LysR family transcriptional regulator [Streptomonospora litoralis]|uniref:HTH-type transcriptional regulator CysL n=1 Tax=Streptomonospora litoralis TaxID=2498135 RepID=A0A4P6PZG4_9ACTN|nr:LysR family transcriptional regulator [Streptomonospora litoralis]QBI53585.1 HTH-type transcriptional regulator CysL [Streptomonospora litoralis]